jgi:hypothetical protein
MLSAKQTTCVCLPGGAVATSLLEQLQAAGGAPHVVAKFSCILYGESAVIVVEENPGSLDIPGPNRASPQGQCLVVIQTLILPSGSAQTEIGKVRCDFQRGGETCKVMDAERRPYFGLQKTFGNQPGAQRTHRS